MARSMAKRGRGKRRSSTSCGLSPRFDETLTYPQGTRRALLERLEIEPDELFGEEMVDGDDEYVNGFVQGARMVRNEVPDKL